MKTPHTDQEHEAAFPSTSKSGGERSASRQESEAPRKERKQILLRLDPGVHAALAQWAADDLRSVNAQIEVLLRQALKSSGRLGEAAPMRGRGRPRKEKSTDI